MTQAESGALIGVLRDHAQITQAELAEALLRDPEEIAAIESGALALQYADARALARIFDLEERRAVSLVDATRADARAAA